jgi:DNA processing protein
MNGNTERNICSIALSIISAPASSTIRESLAAGSAREAWERVQSLHDPDTQSYLRCRYSERPIRAAEEIHDACVRKSIAVTGWWDDDYPSLLREIANPPLVLYMKGAFPAGEKIAVVGTRAADRTSCDVARRVSSELAAAGIVVVSGMAVGIDREAHLGALEGKNPTIGVLANGIDVVYPAANRDLYAAIAASGNSALVSEYPPEIMAGKWTFTRRNRIISGLSRGTVVIKAGERSGALITARYAMEQNREVFACPGHAFDKSYFGCHRLIRQGAQCVSTTADIFSELERFAFAARRGPVPLPAGREQYGDGSLEARILDLAGGGGIDVDSLVRSLEAGAGPVNEALVNLEFDERVVRNGNTIVKI